MLIQWAEGEIGPGVSLMASYVSASVRWSPVSMVFLPGVRESSVTSNAKEHLVAQWPSRTLSPTVPEAHIGIGLFYRRMVPKY